MAVPLSANTAIETITVDVLVNSQPDAQLLVQRDTFSARIMF